jgi:hypothetical protein
VWSSSLRPPLDLKPPLLPEDADDDDDRAVAELLDAALEGDLARSKSKPLRSVPPTARDSLGFGSRSDCGVGFRLNWSRAGEAADERGGGGEP